MNLGPWGIDELLTFTVNTHIPTSGEEANADELPTYRVYEDEDETPIMTGEMTLFDDANTVGYYSEQIELTELAGFQVGHSYTIRVRATVDSISGSLVHTFQVTNSGAAGISGSDVWAFPGRTLTSYSPIRFYGPVAAPDGDFEIIVGDAYAASDGRSLSWVFTDPVSDWDGKPINLYARMKKSSPIIAFTLTGECEQSGTTVTAVIEVTAEESEALVPGQYAFQLTGFPGDDDRPITPVRGSGVVVNNIAPPVIPEP